jgi:hypothetical protein
MVARGEVSAQRGGAPVHPQVVADLAQLSGLVDLWEPALGWSYRMGYARGLDIGVVQGRAEEAQAWRSILLPYREAVQIPALTELHARRDSPARACDVGCGRCSGCVRAVASARNVLRYGSPDFRGGDAP